MTDVLSQSIRLATFNIQHGAKGDYGRGYPELVAEACRDLDADILGLQEVDVGVPRSQRANLASIAAEAAGMDYVFARARTYRGRGQVGNALLVRGEMSNVEILQLKGDWQTMKILGHRLEFLPEPRNVIIARVAIKGFEVTVGVTHTGGKEKNIAMLGRAAASILNRPGPHVLMGDYNVDFSAAYECMEPYGFNVVEGPPTNPAWQPTRHIDHIALRGLRHHGVNAVHLPISDHLALVADVEPASSDSTQPI